MSRSVVANTSESIKVAIKISPFTDKLGGLDSFFSLHLGLLKMFQGCVWKWENMGNSAQYGHCGIPEIKIHQRIRGNSNFGSLALLNSSNYSKVKKQKIFTRIKCAS